jgi:type I restriction enzyme, S subunit
MSWKEVKLGDVGEIVSGSTPKTNIENFWGGSFKWITPAELIRGYNGHISQTERTLSEEGFKSSSLKLLPKGSILLTSRAPIGKVAIAGCPMCTNQGFKSIICNEKVIKGEYLYHYLVQQYDKLNDLGRGATFKEISKTIVQNIIIPLPPLEIQKRIVELLDRAQALIDKRKEQIALMDQLIQSLFHDMFGDPVTNPMGWPSRELCSISEIKSGVTKGRKLEGKETVKIPYMRVANVQDGHLNLEDIAEIEVLPKDVTTYKLQRNDLLLTEGGDPDKLGRGAIWKGEIKNCIHQNHIFRVRLFPHVMIPEYASRLIGSQRGKRYFLKSAKQTTGIASINMTQLKRCSMLLPPIDLQNTFAERVQQIETQKEAMTTSLHELEDNFNSLMQRTFKGEI